MSNINPIQTFWDNKILSWDRKRYGPKYWLEEIGASSILFRHSYAVELLSHIVQGRRVLDLACGTGRLASSLTPFKFKSYTGIDISKAAIQECQKIPINFEQENINFIHGDINSINYESYDVIISLGLTDWLSNEEIAQVFDKCRDKLFLHSFSEQRNLSVNLLFHKLYKKLSRESRSPRYYKFSKLSEIAKIDPSMYNICRDKRMRFGSFITNINTGTK